MLKIKYAIQKEEIIGIYLGVSVFNLFMPNIIEFFFYLLIIMLILYFASTNYITNKMKSILVAFI